MYFLGQERRSVDQSQHERLQMVKDALHVRRLHAAGARCSMATLRGVLQGARIRALYRSWHRWRARHSSAAAGRPGRDLELAAELACEKENQKREVWGDLRRNHV